MQRNPSDVAAPNTARAQALEEVATMLAHEVTASLRVSRPKLADAFQRIVLGAETDVEIDADLEDWLNRGLGYRNFDFGPSLREQGEARRAEYDDTAARLN